jgi:hypothetical protein
MFCSLSSAMAPKKVTSARSFEELMDTVIPVLSAGSRITFETSTPPLSRISKQKLPQTSVPIRLKKETALPSRAKPIAQSRRTAKHHCKVTGEDFLSWSRKRPTPMQDHVRIELSSDKNLRHRKKGRQFDLLFPSHSTNATGTMVLAMTKETDRPTLGGESQSGPRLG